MENSRKEEIKCGKWNYLPQLQIVSKSSKLQLSTNLIFFRQQILGIISGNARKIVLTLCQAEKVNTLCINVYIVNR